MVDNPNPGNFHNRPHEEVQNIARKGGQSSHKGGFASMDRDKQRNIASKGGHASGGKFERGSERTKEAGRRGGHARSRSREGGSGYQEQKAVGDTQEPVEVEETGEFAEEPEEEYEE